MLYPITATIPPPQCWRYSCLETAFFSQMTLSNRLEKPSHIAWISVTSWPQVFSISVLQSPTVYPGLLLIFGYSETSTSSLHHISSAVSLDVPCFMSASSTYIDCRLQEEIIFLLLVVYTIKTQYLAGNTVCTKHSHTWREEGQAWEKGNTFQARNATKTKLLSFSMVLKINWSVSSFFCHPMFDLFLP